MLDEYPQPSVAVDTAALTYDPVRAEILVLQVRRPDGPGWALPGTFMHIDELLADAVARSLRDKAGVTGVVPRQLHVFDALDRDDRGRVLAVAHMAVVRLDRLADRLPATRLTPVHRPGRMWRDHADIIDLARVRLEDEHRARPDPYGLLADGDGDTADDTADDVAAWGNAFTLRELRRLHEAVAGTTLQPDTFKRRMAPYLVETGHTVTSGRGRPAELFRRR
ncbi:NUDIX hydrolase [Mycolicibacterium grossiae]|uniref:NUDIX hydrolase n=1 Tax=Mycolicibacterium grossiae TaxID=1552759 RepID=A0A1E8Q531_9MYCO|nr:NUDIX domain-containing protein [Mycolicibacterium grossiae]OFJ53361.1 hypothetical protein BEL07_12915 [Mycolicibacterium grossiae]QEM43601.1 NUDIX hydrolase [Mycolicibacterium grossiae]